MARYVAQDYYERGNIPDASNTAHSQGTIITSNAIKLYNQTYGQGFDLDGNRLPQWYDTQINQTQSVNAVGPAVSRGLWENTTESLGSNVKENSAFEHKKNDSILSLTSSLNPVEFVMGLVNLVNIQDHDVKNYKYSYYITDTSYKEKHNFPKPIDVQPNYPDPRKTLKQLQNGEKNVYNPYGIKP